MTKYKELVPESETENYFKVGDMIRCRGTNVPLAIRKVLGVYGDKLVFKTEIAHHMVLFKICIKLEEIKPGEHWICKKHRCISIHSGKQHMSNFLNTDECNWARFREVIEND